MKMKRILIIIFLLLSLSSCTIKDGIEILLWAFSDKKEPEETEEEKQKNLFKFEEAQRRLDLWWAVKGEDVNNVRLFLEEGYDPNVCKGELGYREGTPLNVIADRLYNTYTRECRGEKIPDPPPDVQMIQMLVEAGADVNLRPYVWWRVYSWDNWFIQEDILKNTFLRKTLEKPITEAEKKEMLAVENKEAARRYVKDVNRVMEALLKAGADPDKRGHPYPFSMDAKRKKITDEEADKYFAKGTRPINEAIKKGMWWESQVDLLLQYTTLDEDSLKAAKESKDPAMIGKINKLWNEQNSGKKGL
ncbi:hypothetical protein [Treponema sp. R6D11]